MVACASILHRHRWRMASALDSAAVLAASSSYFFIGGILYLFCTSAILTQSRCEDPMNFIQVECPCTKGCSDFRVQEMPLPSLFYLSCGTLHAITFLNNPGFIFLLHCLWKHKNIMFKLCCKFHTICIFH